MSIKQLFRKLTFVLRDRFVNAPMAAASIKKSGGSRWQSNKVRLFVDFIYSYLRYGCNVENYLAFEYYRKNHKERNAYLTFRRSKSLKQLSKSAEPIFLDKASFNQEFKRFIHRRWLDTRKVESSAVESFINEMDTVIVKPLDSCFGRGIEKVEAGNKSTFVHEVANGHDYIVEEVLVNDEMIRRLNPSSVNTIRVVTCLDTSDNVHIIETLIRIGLTDACIDNAMGGGVACAIDPNTGLIRSDGIDLRGNAYTHHPRTGIELKGYQIPRWNEVINLVKELALVNRNARFVGWDIAITPSYLEVIEGNIPPGENITQAFKGKGIYPELKKLLGIA